MRKPHYPSKPSGDRTNSKRKRAGSRRTKHLKK